MVLCQHGSELQLLVDVQDNVDWTRVSQFYSNLGEIPLFISSHRQAALSQPVSNNVDPTKLQGKQLLVYNVISQHFRSSNTEPVYIIISGTAVTGKSYVINCLKSLFHNQLRVYAPTGVASYSIQGYTLHSLFILSIKGISRNSKDKDYITFNSCLQK